jgi:cbb3-type cytochrome c oxidase subunit II
MTPATTIIGSMVLFWTAFLVVVVVPMMTMSEQPSDVWRPSTPREERGRRLYIANGCVYCHSQYVRPQDWDVGAQRIARPGDYAAQFPPLLGSQRTGPDLSQEGGEHPDDWHVAHFANPRYTSPVSIMPAFSFHTPAEIADLTGYVQALGGRDADLRVARQQHWRQEALAAYARGADANTAWLHSRVPASWRAMPNPYPPTEAALARGARVYEQYCIGCHGPSGDGRGPAEAHLKPPPLNFANLRRHLVEGKYIGGLLYYQVMNGVTGTAMPYFKTQLESARIWDVSNYVAYSFIGHTDAQYSRDHIPPSYEGRPPPLPKDYAVEAP